MIPLPKNSPLIDRRFLYLAAVTLLAHLALQIPGLCSGDPAGFFSRPDTAGYLAPAMALSSGQGFGECVERAPGFPLILAAVCRTPAGAALLFGLIGIWTAIPVYRAGMRYAGKNAGLLAAGLFLWNPTVMANRGLWLSDTLFGLFAAYQCYFLLEFLEDGKRKDWFLTVGIAAFGALIRPINLAWIVSALFLLAIRKGITLREKCFRGIAGAALFFAILFPWEMRNASLGAGYCIDTNTGAMYHQNGAMILAAVNHSSFEEEKARILKNLEVEFADRSRYPDAGSRTAYRLKKFRELIAAHPVIWIRQHFRPHVLIPDAAALCEDLGVTSPGRGTLDILHRRGLVPAILHYFDGRWYIPLLLLPLLLPAGLLLVGVLPEICRLLRNIRTEYLMIFAVLACAEYYFFLPGPITVPRYQIPALPILCVLGAAGLLKLREHILIRMHRMN